MKEALLLLVIALGLVKLKRKGKASRSSRWSRAWLLKRGRFCHVNLFRELRNEPQDLCNYLRMDMETYIYAAVVTPYIQKQNTHMRKPISPHERLTATLRFLATGRSYKDLEFSTIISKQALSNIIPETCKAIYKALKMDFLKFPTTQEEWIDIASRFEKKCQFPHCLGAVDGKHISIVPPAQSGSYYYNYKKTRSIVLMAIVNANCEFVYCDVGTNGRISDGGVMPPQFFLRSYYVETKE